MQRVLVYEYELPALQVSQRHVRMHTMLQDIGMCWMYSLRMVYASITNSIL